MAPRKHHHRTLTPRGRGGDPSTWPDDYLASRQEASAYSVWFGLPTAPSTFAKIECYDSDGPPTIRFGRQVRYPIGALREWLLSRATSNTSHAIRPLLTAAEIARPAGKGPGGRPRKARAAAEVSS